MIIRLDDSTLQKPIRIGDLTGTDPDENYELQMRLILSYNSSFIDESKKIKREDMQGFQKVKNGPTLLKYFTKL